MVRVRCASQYPALVATDFVSYPRLKSVWHRMNTAEILLAAFNFMLFFFQRDKIAVKCLRICLQTVMTCGQ